MQEAGELAEAVPVVAAPAVVVQPQRRVQVQVVAGPGEGDVEQTVFLGQPARVTEGHIARQGAVDQVRYVHDGPFQALGGVDGGDGEVVLVQPGRAGQVRAGHRRVHFNRVPARDTGLASSLLNTGQQVGGAIGLAALGTVAWTAVASSARSQAVHAAAAARSGHAQLSLQARASIYHHALAVGITRGFLAASGIALAGLVITVITIRVRREDLAGTAEPAQDRPAGAEPALEQARS